MKYQVIFYKDNRGRSPMKSFLDDLQIKANSQKYSKQLFKKIVLYIEVLEKMGSRAGLPYTRNIGDGIWELRPNRYRIFFFIWKGNQIILLHSFYKKTKKTPLTEIQRAKREKRDWLKNGHKRILTTDIKD